MEKCLQNQFEEIVEFELSGEPPRVVRRRSMFPLRDHQFPSGGEIIHCKDGASNVLRLATRHFNAALDQCKRCMLPGTVLLVCNLWPVSLAVRVLDDWDALRDTRNIVGCPFSSFREKTSGDTVYKHLLRFSSGPRTDTLTSMHVGCPPTSRHISSTKALSHGNRTGAKGEPK